MRPGESCGLEAGWGEWERRGELNDTKSAAVDLIDRTRDRDRDI